MRRMLFARFRSCLLSLLVVQGVVCLSLLTISVVAGAQEREQEREQEKERADHGRYGKEDEEAKDAPLLRQDWFYKARAYPNKTIPINALQHAWEQAQKLPVVLPRSGNGNFQTRGGGAWQFWGPSDNVFTDGAGNDYPLNLSCRVNSIAIHPTTPSTVYICAAKGGLWKSTDSGTTWTNLTDGLSTQASGCVVLDPVTPTTIYYGTGEGYLYNSIGVTGLTGVGIFKSTDSGVTWTLKGNSTLAGHDVNDILIDPANTSHWIVATHDGIYTTTDGGTTFTMRQAGNVWTIRSTSSSSATTLFAAVGEPFSYYPASAALNGVYKSTDGGNTWTRQTASGLPVGTAVGRVNLDICKANPSVIYAAFASISDYSLNSIWKTTNGGTSWTNVTNGANPGGNQGWYDFVIRVSPTDPNTAFIGTYGLVKTSNGGTSWSAQTFPNGHPDMHAIAFDPTNSQNVYLGQDGGLYYSSDGGSNWNQKDTGRGAMEFYGFDIHPTDPNQLMAGAQDNGIFLRTATLNPPLPANTYLNLSEGDGTAAAFNASDPNKVVLSFQQAEVITSTDSGFTGSVTFSKPSGDSASWAAPLINDHTTPTRFYVGTSHVYRSNNNGATWSMVSPVLTGGSYLNIIAVAPSSSNVVYTGSVDGKVYVCKTASSLADNSANASAWTDVSAGLATASVGGIAVDPTNPAIVYIGLQGYAQPHQVYKSVNYGSTWTDITGNLPQTAVNSLVVSPGDPTTLFAGTDTGVFVTSSGGASWANYGTGLPTAFCTMLRASATTGYLTVSTLGRGMWRIPLTSSSNPVPTLTGLSPNNTLAGGAAFTLTVNGTNFINGSTVQWNGSNRTTTYVSATQLTATITAADIANAGTANVTVFTGAPGGGTSNALTFTINNPAPIVTGLSPNNALAGGAAFTLTVNGTGFVNGSVVRWNSTNRTTSYVSATQLTASISAADIATAGTVSVTVFNPTPGGGASNAATFTINNPAPVLTSLNPNSTTVGSGAFTLMVNGTGFVNGGFGVGSTVYWNGTSRSTTYVSPTQLTATINAMDVSTAGTASVTVNTPAPGGGTSNALTFTINTPSNPAPIAGLAGAALQFTSANQNVSVPNFGSVAPNNEITIEYWQNVAAVQDQFVFSINSGNANNRITTTGPWHDGVIYWDFGNLFGTGRLFYTPPVSLVGTWQHFAFVASNSGANNPVGNGSYMAIYRNGVREAYKSGSGTFAATAVPLYLSDPISPYGGQLDEIRVWSIARSADDIAADFNASLHGDESGLLAYYRLDDGTGSATIADATGNGYTGQINHTPTWLASGAPIDTVHVTPGVGRTILLAGFDKNNPAKPMTFAIATAPTKGTFSGSSPAFSYTPGSGYTGVGTGADMFTYTATSNGSAASAPATVKITYVNTTSNVSGTLNFEGLVGTAAAQRVTFTFRPSDGTTPVVRVQNVPASGAFTVTGLPKKNYTLHIKGDRYLAVNVTANASTANVTGLTATLPAGDADNNNVVDLGDFGVLVNAYLGTASDPTSGYDIRSDFNGDGIVDLADFGLMVNNFGSAGDP